MSVNKKLKKCFKEGEKGERHKGLRKISINEEKVKGHLQKAIHNLNAMTLFKRMGFSDWSASAGFYSLYHLLLSLIAKEGFESRNQSCTFALIEKMIDEEKLSITKDTLKEIFDKDVTTDIAHSSKILDLRENMQYSIKTSLEEEEFIALKEKITELFHKLRLELEE